MKVILNENIEGLGTIGDLVNVKPGYARNFLLPRKMAVVADEKNVKEFEHQKREAERKLEKLTQDASSLKEKVEAVSCVVAHRAGEEGKLFGSVTNIELVEKLVEAGLEIDRKQILLKEPIKTLGEHEVPVKLNAGVTATLKVVVEASEEE